jgi:hypothetical protein
MKTSLDVPDDLYREIKVKAAREGRKVSDLVAEGLRLVLVQAPAAKRRVEFPILKDDPMRPSISADDVERALKGMEEEEDARIAASIRH